MYKCIYLSCLHEYEWSFCPLEEIKSWSDVQTFIACTTPGSGNWFAHHLQSCGGEWRGEGVDWMGEGGEGGGDGDGGGVGQLS